MQHAADEVKKQIKLIAVKSERGRTVAFRCEACGKHTRASDQDLHKTATCRHCEHRGVVEETDADKLDREYRKVEDQITRVNDMIRDIEDHYTLILFKDRLEEIRGGLKKDQETIDELSRRLSVMEEELKVKSYKKP